MLGSPVRVSPPHCFCTEQKTIPKRTGKLYLSCERGRAGGLHVKCEDGMIGSAPPPCPTTVLRYCLVILHTQLSYRCALRKCAMPMPVHNYSRPRRRAHCSAIPPAFSAIYRLCFDISTNRGAHISFVLTDSQKTRGGCPLPMFTRHSVAEPHSLTVTFAWPILCRFSQPAKHSDSPLACPEFRGATAFSAPLPCNSFVSA